MDEPFDVVDEDGRPTGEVRARSEVHRLGLWHRAFHLFLASRRGGTPRAILQLRAAEKDVAPGCVDVAVGGHFRAGETLAQVVRECEEEIGLAVRPEELAFLWRQRAEHVAPGVWDRELQDVYLLVRDDPPAAYRPDPVELGGLFEVELAELVAALEGPAPSFTAEGLARQGGGFVAARRTFTSADVHEGDRANLLRAAREALARLAEAC